MTEQENVSLIRKFFLSPLHRLIVVEQAAESVDNVEAGNKELNQALEY
jgi:hypothetical protein